MYTEIRSTPKTDTRPSVLDLITADTQRDLQNPAIADLLWLAYQIGREDGVRDMSDKYRALIRQMRERADACRYKHMAHDVIGDKDYIYHPDYAGDMKSMFGRDKIPEKYLTIK